MAEGISTDFLILCDAAQVQGEKLYMLGGGWTQIWVKQLPAQHHMAVAAGILIPWLETNAKHQFKLVVRAEDGAAFSEVQGEFEQGRPPGLPPGSAQRVMLAINMNIRIERACEAVAEIALDGQVSKAVPFRIVQQPAR
ncbi:MAG TPA: hypothetical protein VJP07_10950 [Dehalococcoidia bacterium]|nr:hypothetical protein [Dehalococcoidia bacterium]